MKKIGLVGGMSWRSTLIYYKYINEFVEKQYGSLNSAKIILSSMNFLEIEPLQRSGQWLKAGKLISKEVQNLLMCGADFIGICSNTGNECVEKLKSQTNAPIINIADSIGEYLKNNNITKAGLIGTIYTMEGNYIKDILLNKYGIRLIIPNKKDRLFVNKVIYQELCSGIIKPESKKRYICIINNLTKRHNLEGFILGCTEIPLLIKQKDISVKIVDSTKIHAEDLAKKSL